MKTFTAVGDNVIVEVTVSVEKVTESGVVIPSRVDRESQSQATVISVGPDVTDLSIGDRVIVSRAVGEVFWLNDKSYLATKKNDIFAILKETEINA